MDIDKNIEAYDLVFLDLETTGLDVVMGDAICEIGALKVRNGEIVDTFHTLVNPKKSIPREAYLVHKISDEEVRTAPVFEAVASRLTAFLTDSVLCAYNVGFDAGFIDGHLRAMGAGLLEVPALDILAMARDALTLTRYNLESVARALEIECTGTLHRALDDARIAYWVFAKIKDVLGAKGIRALVDYISLYGYRNDAMRARENEHMVILENAITAKRPITVEYFSLAKKVVQESILPLKVFREKQFWYLLYEGSTTGACRLCSNRILKIKTA